MYEAGSNPAVTLYTLWHMLLKAQGVIKKPHHNLRKEGNNYYGNDYTSEYPKVAYGDKNCAIGVWGWDDQGRPLIAYGQWYRRQYGLHVYLVLDAEGRFLLIHPHGDNHNRIERHTFLGYTHAKSQYLWFVDPKHEPQEGGHWRKSSALTLEDGFPFMYERRIKSGWKWDRSLGRARQEEKWLILERRDDGLWLMKADPNMEPDLKAVVDKSSALSERHYRRLANIKKRAELSVRSGKTTLMNDDAVIHIAALLDVSQPAKATPLRPKIAEEATV